MRWILPTRIKTQGRNLGSKRSGFTLIEMICVVTLLVIVALAVMPLLVSMKATSDRRDALSAIRRMGPDARERAIQSGQTTQITYDESSNQFEIDAVSDDGTTTMLAQTPVTPGLEPQRYVLNGNETTSADFKLTFTPDGHSIGGGIEFTDFSIEVDPDGATKSIDGPLPAPEDERWQAGDLEQRQQQPQ